jgi:hypothetical protein
LLFLLFSQLLSSPLLVERRFIYMYIYEGIK